MSHVTMQLYSLLAAFGGLQESLIAVQVATSHAHSTGTSVCEGVPLS